MWTLLGRVCISVRAGRVTRSNKPKNGESKETNGLAMELGDCLRVGAITTYGNRALIVPRPLIQGRRAGLNLRVISRDSRGYRDYSTSHTRKTDTEFPKKYLKLAAFCTKNPNLNVPDNLFTLMRDPRMYQIAYDKLKSNPVNMTPGIKPQTLDGISLD